MDLKVYYGGHSISDKGILRLKLKTDFTQQEEVGALYATLSAEPYRLLIDDVIYGAFNVDSVRIDSKFDTTLTLKGFYDNGVFAVLFDKLKQTTEDEMGVVTLEKAGG